MSSRKSLEGQHFGKLIAVKELPPATKGGNYRYECRCDCGNTIIARRGNLTSGNTTSCGCTRKGHTHSKDLTGQRFGRLVAIKPTGKKSHTNVIWLCQCDCGKQVEVSTSNLGKHTYSCGCWLRDHGIERGEDIHQKLVANEWKDGTSLCALTMKTPKSNTSGRKGVCFDRRRQKWLAFITIQKKHKHLGYFSKFEDAVNAREEAEAELFEPVLNAHGRTLYERKSHDDE